MSWRARQGEEAGSGQDGAPTRRRLPAGTQGGCAGSRLRRSWLLGWVLGVLAAGSAGCSDHQASPKELILAIEVQAREPGAMVDLGTAAPFEWDCVAIFEPYTTATEVRETLGFPWQSRAVAQIGASDGHDLFLFSGKGRIVAEMLVPAGALDFSRAIVRQRFERRDARFSVRRDRSGRTILDRLAPPQARSAPSVRQGS